MNKHTMRGCPFPKANNIEVQEECIAEQEHLEISYNDLLEALKNAVYLAGRYELKLYPHKSSRVKELEAILTKAKDKYSRH